MGQGQILDKKKDKKNKKHSENADTSTSVTFDLDVWPWLQGHENH